MDGFLGNIPAYLTAIGQTLYIVVIAMVVSGVLGLVLELDQLTAATDPSGERTV